LQSMKSTLRQQFNLAVCESAHQDSRQQAQLTLASVAGTRALLDTQFQRVEDFITSRYGLRIARVAFQYL
jgi:uncharacterized protein YlxP (DUF503 family)